MDAHSKEQQGLSAFVLILIILIHDRTKIVLNTLQSHRHVIVSVRVSATDRLSDNALATDENSPVCPAQNFR